VWNEVAEKKRGLTAGEETKKFVACVNSYLGIMKHYQTSKLRKKIALGFNGEILKSFVFSNNFEKVELAT
jgi:hypothetical protein